MAECEILPDDIKSDESTSPTESNQDKDTTQSGSQTNQTDNYLSDVKESDDRIYSDGQNKEKDKYETASKDFWEKYD